jgi:hypothetical protein
VPTVPTYGGRKVATEALPGVRKMAAETNLSTGVGLDVAQGQADATKWEGIAGLASGAGRMATAAYTKMADDERQRADEVALLEAENKLSRWEQQRLYDPATGALAVKGKDAMPLPETVGGEFEKVAGEVAAGLNTDRQRQAYEKLKAHHGLNLDLTLRRHVYGEMQQYETRELKAFVENGTQSAVANALEPRRVGEELHKVTAAIATSGPRLGLGPEEIKAAVGAAQSQVHVGVIDRLLSTDNESAAQAYFDETKGQIKGDVLAKVERALEEGGLRKKSQTQADTIVQAGGSLSQQLDQVRAIEDPKLRDAVRERVEHEAAITARVTREQEEATLRGVYDIVDRTQDVTKIPAVVWAGLSGSERAAARSYADHLARGVAVETDLPTYYGLLRKAGDDPAAFSTDNLLSYRGKLGEAEFKHLAGLQLSIRTGDREKAEKDLAGFRTHSQIVDDSLTLYGIETHESKQTKGEAAAVAQLRQMLDRRVQAQAELTGKKPTNDDIQRTLDALLSQSVKVPGSWWNFFPGGQPFFDSTKRLIDTTITDVPATDRQQIEAALRKAGRPISDATILDLYLEHRTRTQK